MVKALAAGTLLAAVAVSASVAFSAPTGTPFDLGTRIASETDVSIIVDRIGGAFVSASSVVADPAIVAAAARASKGNLAFIPACASAVWPNIEATCLATADGRPASDVRIITIGYQVGDNTIVLLRIPAAEIALR